MKRKYYFFWSLLLGLMGVTASAQITSTSAINNNKTFTIKSVNRGFIYYDGANSTDYLYSSSHTDLTNASPTGTTNQQFALLQGENTPDGYYYLYSIGASKFVTAETTTDGLRLTDAPSISGRVTLTANGSYFIITYPGVGNKIVNITNWNARNGIRCVSGASADEGNKMTIKEAATTDLTAAVNQINAIETPTICQIRAKDNARGVLYAGNAAGNGANGNSEMSTAGSTYRTSNGYKDFTSVRISTDNVYQQFALIKWQGNTYLYSIGTQSYVYNAGGYFAFSQTSSEPIELQAVTSSGNTAYKLLKFKTSNTYLTFSNGGGRHAINPQTNRTATTTDEGDMIAINYSNTILTQNEYAKAISLFVIPEARNFLSAAGDGTQVGIPTAEGKADITAKIAALEASLTAGTATYAQVLELKNAVDNCPVHLPQDGKAYTFTFKHMNNARTYLYWDSTNDQLDAAVLANGGTLPETATFICRSVTVSGSKKFMFVNNQGKYLTWKGVNSGDGYNSNKGGTDTYNATYNLFTLETITPSAANVNADAAFLAGTLALKSVRANGSDVGYFVIKAAGGFDKTNAPFVTNSGNYYSTAVMIEEATYPNNVTFKATDINNGAGSTYALATFSAPFATVIPEGVTAYNAIQDTGNSDIIIMSAISEGSALPAGAGFILSGTADATVTMVPATNEGLVSTAGTLLVGSAGRTVALDPTYDYVLGQKDGHVAFYHVNSSNNVLPMNRAYLHFTGGGVVKMNFNHTTTGIEAVSPAAQQDGPIYDLSGRRVSHMSKGGIYIRNGKKILVK